MDITLLTDLIKDDRGNYYVAVEQQDEQLTVVNALLERSYRTALEFNDAFRRAYAKYEGQYIGKIAADELRHDIVFAMKEEEPSRIYALDDITQHYLVSFIDTTEFYRNPQAVRK